MNYQLEQSKVRKAIAKFFGVKMNSYQDISGVSVDTVMDEMASLGIILAGGAITSVFSNLNINDLDFYCKYSDSQSVNKVKAFFQGFCGNPSFESSNALTYKRRSTRSNHVYNIQFITRFHGSPEQIMDWFDFTITQGSYDFFNNDFVLGDRFLQDIARRKLIFLGKSMFPICAMYRTKKYQAKGYTMPGSTVMHIALCIVRLKIETYKQLKEQLMGIDTSYLQNLFDAPHMQSKFGESLPYDYGTFIKEAFDSIDGFAHEDDVDEENGSR